MRLVLTEPPYPSRTAITGAYRAPEEQLLARLVTQARLPDAAAVAARARSLVEAVRSTPQRGGVESFLATYGLSTREGIVLMSLAEALLRIPDAGIANRLIQDKMGSAEWDSQIGQSDSLFVNASTWALMLTGRLLSDDDGNDLGGIAKRLLARGSRPLIREALLQAMRLMGSQFVMGETIAAALQRADDRDNRRYCHSFDMLGEAARTEEDADRYFAAYADAIAALGKAAVGCDLQDAPGISVKLSALHPRFEHAQEARVLRSLPDRLIALNGLARDAGIGLTVDAEEADRLDLTLDVFAISAAPKSLQGWDGLGLAVQAYQKRARPVIDWLVALGTAQKRRLMIRLVKGAYWDSEIKRSQEGGFRDYPVFTRKVGTDVSYLACTRALLAAGERVIYPQLATHNAYTLAAVLQLAGTRRSFEFQRLHGMGEALYEAVLDSDPSLRCRVYAPVGDHRDLLPYLVRRLLENGANTSFVHKVVDPDEPIDALVADPVARVEESGARRNRAIHLPRDLYGDRANAIGLDLSEPSVRADIEAALARSDAPLAEANPIVGGEIRTGPAQPVTDPANRNQTVGTVVLARPRDVEDALARAHAFAPEWAATPVETRAAALDRLAGLMERNIHNLVALAIREAGKTWGDAVAEVREALDYGRYYASRARADFAAALVLPGPTGERNELHLGGRGVFACIAPWNFPLAIFLGQVTAALAAGNTVIAKPAEQTPLMAAAAIRLANQAGIPVDALHLLPGTGEVVGAALVKDRRVCGIAFTGSVDTAQAIQRGLAARGGPIVPFIAETGGQNAMIVDSSALPEQVVTDVLASAFQSAGQRCSALRVLFLQDEITPRVIAMLKGAMDKLVVGDPRALSTDVGPVIDDDALAHLQKHIARMERDATILHRAPLQPATEHGTFLAPHLIEIYGIEVLSGEVFGPALHVVRYGAEALDRVIDSINATTYGLTLDIHTRIDATAEHIFRRAKVGNTYVNRGMIGAVVGVQPFGVQGLSGTGPKAGGPFYLHRFATEKTRSINTAAVGGNAALLNLDDDA